MGAAQADASSRLAEERERIEAERGANEELRNEALGMVDGLAAQNAALRANAMALEVQVAELEERIRKLNVSEFKDRVIREIADRLLDGGRTAAQVLRDLPLSLVREAERYRESLTPGEINKKMTVRAEHGRYFLRHGDGSLTRKPPRAAAGQDVTGGSARGPARADDPSEGAPGSAS